MKIAVETQVLASLHTVWNAWITPDSITQWNFASPEWRCPRAELNLIEGGTFTYRMESRDGALSFDFEGTFIHIEPYHSIHFELNDKRVVTVEFQTTPDGVRVMETFDADEENNPEQQRQGWQSILDNFKSHVESAR